MPDEHETDRREVQARAALGYLGELQPDLLGGVVVSPSGEVVYSDFPLESSADVLELMWKQTGVGPGREAGEFHVATPEGEVFAVAEDAYALVAIAERFALGSLLLFDMRSALRLMGDGDAA